MRKARIFYCPKYGTPISIGATIKMIRSHMMEASMDEGYGIPVLAFFRNGVEARIETLNPPAVWSQWFVEMAPRKAKKLKRRFDRR